jgi:hypothetical protein
VVCDQQILESVFEADRAPDRIVFVIVVRALPFLDVFVLKVAVQLVAHEIVGAFLDGRLLSSLGSS